MIIVFITTDKTAHMPELQRNSCEVILSQIPPRLRVSA